MSETGVKPLIEELTKTIPMLVRKSPPPGDYLEGVLSTDDLERCCALLTSVFGVPVKEFGKAATLDPSLQQAVSAIGGIRLEQCLYLKPAGQEEILYAALWPWASDSSRVTLKIGVSARGG